MAFAVQANSTPTALIKPPDGIEPSCPLYKSGASPLNALRAPSSLPGGFVFLSDCSSALAPTDNVAFDDTGFTLHETLHVDLPVWQAK